MKILDYPEYDILYVSPSIDMTRMGEGARTCYKTPYGGFKKDSELVSMCFENEHHSVLEHSSMTVKFICDRGVSHELVRHRLASFSQESTRYCNYSKDRFGGEITVVKPVRIHSDSLEYFVWEQACEEAEKAYFKLLDFGITPENARSVLPTCLKTEIIVTGNLREWYHILDLRTARDAHPDMRYMMHGLLLDMDLKFPEIFHDLALERNAAFLHDFREKGNE